MSFPVVILAGGLATRLGALTKTIPKALIDINGEPFIAHQLRLLKANGIDRVVICIGYLGEMIQDCVGNGSSFEMEVNYSNDGPTLRGTGGAIKQALHLLDDCFFVLYGDSYLRCDYPQIQQRFEQSGKQGLMTVLHNEGQWDKSNVVFDGEIEDYDKKSQNPEMKHIDYGLGILRKSVFDLFPAHEVFDLAVVYQTLLKQNQLAAFEVEGRFYEIGSLEGIEALSNLLKNEA